MNEYLITFRSMTQAQNGQRALQLSAVHAELRRTPKSVADRGCGYSLAVEDRDLLRRAAEALRKRNVFYSKLFRVTEEGGLEEVIL